MEDRPATVPLTSGDYKVSFRGGSETSTAGGPYKWSETKGRSSLACCLSTRDGGSWPGARRVGSNDEGGMGLVGAGQGSGEVEAQSSVEDGVLAGGLDVAECPE
jgi:hypothetical protein